MNLDKAIEIKQLALDTGIVNNPDDFMTADMISIEAMKRIDHNRLINNHPDQAKLPGETED